MLIKNKILALRALSVLGCFLSLCSTVFPFLLEHYPGECWWASDDVSYWSFKSSTQHEAFGEPRGPAQESWLYDYWVKVSVYGTGFLPLFASMFAAQILTLITGIASVFIKGKYFVLVPVALCTMTVVLMTYAIFSLKGKGWWDFRQGYGLTVLSLCAFLSVLILSHAWRKRYSESNVTSTHVQAQ